MIARGTKPNRCKHCRERMPVELARHVLHEDCIDPWIAAQAVKKEAARKKKEVAARKVEKAEHRRKLAEHKKLSAWFEEAQTAVNAFIRARDAGLPCISCGTPWARDFQAGHYRSRGAAKNLALDPRNIHGQCVQCNLHKHSNAVEYRIRLVARFGVAFVEAIEADHTPRHLSADDLQRIKAEFVAATRALKRDQEASA